LVCLVVDEVHKVTWYVLLLCVLICHFETMCTAVSCLLRLNSHTVGFLVSKVNIRVFPEKVRVVLE